MFRVPLWTGALSALFFVVTGIQFWVTKYLVDVIGVEQGPVCGAGCTSPSSLCHSVLSTPPLSQPVSHHTRCVRFFLPIPSPIPSDPIPAPHRSVQHGDRSLCTRSLVHLLARTAQVTPVFGATSISAPLLGVFIGGYIIDKLGGYQGAAGLALTLKCCMIFGTVAASMGVCTVPL